MTDYLTLADGVVKVFKQRIVLEGRVENPLQTAIDELPGFSVADLMVAVTLAKIKLGWPA